MMKGGKKILLVSNAFYPEISPRSFRATELAKAFLNQGHEVTVVTRPRDHDYSGFIKEYPLNLIMWGRYRFPPLPVFTRKPFKIINRVIVRMSSLLLEYPAIEDMFKVKRILKGKARFDLMISFAVPYPVQWGVAWARSGKNRIADIWVADCGDPYMGDRLDSFRKMFYFKYLEKWFCRKADYISVPVETAKPGYYSEFHDKIRVIPQGFDFDLQQFKERRIDNPVPEFAYAGGFLHGIRDPVPLLEYLKSGNRPFRFHVFTSQPEFLNAYSQSLKGRLFIHSYIEREKLMRILSGMDFLINFDNNTTLNIPSKLIDYAITGRPVLNIEKNFNPEDIEAFLSGNYEKRLRLPDPEQYHINRVSQQFLELITETGV